MTVKIRSTRVACPTTTGTQTITITGFGTPKAVVFVLTFATADGSAADGGLLAIGAATSTTEKWVSMLSEDHGVSGTNTARYRAESVAIGAVNGSGVPTGYADFVGFVTDGVQINWMDAFPAGYLLTVVLLGGDELTVKAGSYTASGTLNGSVDVTNVGFKADLLLLAKENTRPGLTIGMVHNSPSDVVTQRAYGWSDRDGVATSTLGARASDLYGLVNVDVAGNIASAQEISAFDASGFSSTTRIGTTYEPGDGSGYLAMAFANHAAWVGTITTPTATGDQAQTGPGFIPQFLLQLLGAAEAVNTAYVDNRAGTRGVSVADADAQYSNASAAEDAVTTSNTESLSDNQLATLHDDDGAAMIAASLASFDTNGWTANFSAVAAAGKIWLALAVEADASGTSVTVQASPIGASAGAPGAAVLAIRNVSIQAGAVGASAGVAAPTAQGIRNAVVEAGAVGSSAAAPGAAVSAVRAVTISAGAIGAAGGAQGAEISAIQNASITAGANGAAAGAGPAIVSNITNVTISAGAVGAAAGTPAAEISAIQNAAIQAGANGSSAGVAAAIVSNSTNVTISAGAIGAVAGSGQASATGQRNVTISQAAIGATAFAHSAIVSTGINATISAGPVGVSIETAGAIVTTVQNATIQAGAVGATAHTGGGSVSTVRNVTIAAGPNSALGQAGRATVSTGSNADVQAGPTGAIAGVAAAAVLAIRNVTIQAGAGQAVAAVHGSVVTTLQNANISAGPVGAVASVHGAIITTDYAPVNVNILAAALSVMAGCGPARAGRSMPERERVYAIALENRVYAIPYENRIDRGEE